MVETQRNKKKLEIMERTLQKVNKHYIRMKKLDMKENTHLVFSFLSKLIEIMRKSDILFDSMNPSLDYLGSYFDRLRVGEPTEYDINIILSIPVKNGSIKLNGSKSSDGYTYIILPSEFRRLSIIPATANKGFIKTKSWCNKNYCLSITKFRAWIQSVIQKALNTLPVEDEKTVIEIDNKPFQLSLKQSGPANTICLIVGNTTIDIDLVPTFAFEIPIEPVESRVDFSKVSKTNISKYFVVPKPNGDDFSWRLSFPLQERQMLLDKYNLKSTIRLMKHFRDVQGFNKIYSYYIKVLFLWECSEKDHIYWKKNSLTYLVLHMLGKLRYCLETHNLRNYWCPTHNLLEQLKPETCQNYANRISYILRKIENSNSENDTIIKYFTKKPKSIKKVNNVLVSLGQNNNNCNEKCSKFDES